MTQNPTVKPITDETTFVGLQDQWNKTADKSASNSIFLRHEWFDAAWQWLKDDCELFVLTVLRDDQIIGICPLIRRTRLHRRIPIHVIEFMLVPDSQACDFICAPSDQELVVNAVVGYLRQRRKYWDAVQLNLIPEGSATTDLLKLTPNARQAGFEVVSAGTNPEIGLEVSWETFYSQRSRRLKKGNNHGANRLKKKFDDIHIDWIQAADLDLQGLARTLSTVVDLSARSWKKEVGHSLDNPGPKRFIERLTSHAHSRNWLSLWILTLDGRPAAMEYQVAYAGYVHALRADFDGDLFELSPGTYLNWKMLERLFQQDFACYQMGPGENAYKKRWTDDSAPLCRGIAYGATARGRLIAFLERKAVPSIKVLAKRFPRLQSRGDKA